MDQKPEELSKEHFQALSESNIWETYEELKKRFKELKIAIGNLKIKNEKVKEEINAHLVLTEGSVEEMKESIKIFENCFAESLERLRKCVISESTLKELQRFGEEYLRVPT
jgi:hypothetical protein